jgi:hypothetical protein
VVIAADAEGLLNVEVPAQPFARGICVSQSLTVIVKERLIPRKPVITEHKKADQNVDGQ